MFRICYFVLVLLFGLLTACTDPNEPDTPADDDDVVSDDDDVADDDDSGDDDDSEPSTPEQVLTPDGAEVGAAGAFVGMRAQAMVGGELTVSNPIEVTLRDSTARSMETGPYVEPSAEDAALFELMRDSLQDVEGASR